MVETASRMAMENALTLYAPHQRQTAARAFVDALAVDELLFLAEFLGGCILATSVTGHDICPRHSHNNSGLVGQIGVGSGCRTWSWGGIGYSPV